MVYKYYTHYEISLHNKKNDAWVIYKNGVYDISDFLKNNLHPISDKPILNKLGKDITNDINFHSGKAKKILKKYQKGYLKNQIQKTACCIL